MSCWIVQALHRRHTSRARAGAVVEFAVVLPVLLTVLFGIIEYGWVFMVRQTLQHAAREGCRLAVLQATVDDEVTARIDEVMQAANLAGYQISLTHNLPIETVQISIPYDQVSLVGGFFGTHDYDLMGSCSMRKEGGGDDGS